MCSLKRDWEVLRYWQKAAGGPPFSILKLQVCLGQTTLNTVSSWQKPLTEAHSCCKIRLAHQSGRGTNGPTSTAEARGIPCPYIEKSISVGFLSLCVIFPPSPHLSSCFAVWTLISSLRWHPLSWKFCFSKCTHLDFSQKGVNCWPVFFCCIPAVFLWHSPVLCV